MLEDAGLIDAARTWEGLTLTPRAEALGVYLDGPEVSTTWSTYYFGFASVTLLPGFAYATILALALFVTALVHVVAVHQ